MNINLNKVNNGNLWCRFAEDFLPRQLWNDKVIYRKIVINIFYFSFKFWVSLKFHLELVAAPYFVTACPNWLRYSSGNWIWLDGFCSFRKYKYNLTENVFIKKFRFLNFRFCYFLKTRFWIQAELVQLIRASESIKLQS